MAVVTSFSAIRYTVPLRHVIAPPYDVISADERSRLAQSSPYNLVHLTLPEQRPDDRSQFVRYARSAATLTEWRREGVLAADGAPGFYAYEQSFTDLVSGENHTRKALFGLLKTEPYETGIVLPHEQTFPKHKEDRLHLLEATRTHLESIYGLYDDSDGRVADVLYRAEFRPLATVATKDGISHAVRVCDDPEAIGRIRTAFAPHRIWIADGHHRYETAVTYRSKHVHSSGVVAEDHLPIALTSLQDPGLVVMPTHRMVKQVSSDTLSRLPELLRPMFDVTACDRSELPEKVRECHDGSQRAIGVVLPDAGYLCVTRDLASMDSLATEEPHSPLWKRLDVVVLHSLMMEKLLGLPKGVEAYTRDESEVFAKVGAEYAIGFLVNAPTVAETRDIAGSGEKMPQKSTYFYPKLLSGLVMWSFADPIGK